MKGDVGGKVHTQVVFRHLSYTSVCLGSADQWSIARITRRCRLFLWLPIRAMSSEDESRLRWKYLTLSDSLIGWIDRNYRDYLYSP